MDVAGSVTADQSHPRRRLGTINDVLKVLPLPRSSLYDLARYDRIPGVVRVGRRIFFDLDVLDEWIANAGGATR